MAGYQYGHVETYALKSKDGKRWSVDEVLDENERKPESSKHVSSPSAPVLVYGQSVAATRQELHERLGNAVDVLKNGKTRKVRNTQNSLVSIVLSHPDEAVTAEYRDWEQRAVEWLKDKYGDRLKTVIRHEDESHPHIHALLIPTDLKAISLHPGYEAKARAAAAGLSVNDQNIAYKSGLRDWQNDYHHAVGVPCGHTRLGPGRRRLTREQWRAEQLQAEALSNVQSQVEQIRHDAEQRGFRSGQAKAVRDFQERNILAKVSLSLDSSRKDEFEKGRKVGTSAEYRRAKAHVDKAKAQTIAITAERDEAQARVKALADEHRRIHEVADRHVRDADERTADARVERDISMNLVERLVHDSIDRRVNPAPVLRGVVSSGQMPVTIADFIAELLELLARIFGDDRPTRPQARTKGYGVGG
jgi:hypothetical protein